MTDQDRPEIVDPYDPRAVAETFDLAGFLAMVEEHITDEDEEQP